MSNNRIVAVVAINDPNASCLERASVSHSIYEIINMRYKAMVDRMAQEFKEEDAEGAPVKKKEAVVK